MIKYSEVDFGDKTMKCEVQIEGDIKLLIAEFGAIAGHLYKAFKYGAKADFAKTMLIAAVETGIQEVEKEQK